jgi:hypothetical protein
MKKLINFFKLKGVKYFYPHFTLITFGLYFSSCTNKDSIYTQKNNRVIFYDNYTLEVVDSIRLELDSETTVNFLSLDYFDNIEERKITLLNKANGNVYTYEYGIENVKSFIRLEKEGPNAVASGDFWGCIPHTLSKDSLLIFCPGGDRKFHILSSVGEKLGAYDWIYPIYSFDYSKNSLVKRIGNKVVLNGTIGKENRSNIVAFDLETKKTSVAFSSPPEIESKCWGLLEYSYHCMSTYNPNTRQFVHSFASSPFLYVTDENFKIQREVYVGSKYFEVVPYFSKNPKDCEGMNYYEPRKQHSLSSPKYFKIIYDEFNNLYYREILHPRTPEEVQSNSPIKRSILIMDQNFTKVGEITIDPRIYNTSLYFINDKGLHFLNKEKTNDQEDFLYFDVFQPKTK